METDTGYANQTAARIVEESNLIGFHEVILNEVGFWKGA